MKTSAPLLLLLAALNATSSAQTGVVIHKDAPWDRDQFARVTLYKKLEKFPTVHNVEPATGQKLRINNSLVLTTLEFPAATVLANLTSDAELKTVEEVIVSWTATLKRFPQSAKILKPRLDALRADAEQFRAGKVKADGVWMTPQQLADKRQREAEERARIAAKLEQEARALEMAQAGWSEKDAARKNARIRAEQAAISADEQKRIAELAAKREAEAARRAKMKPAERLSSDEWVTPPTLKDEKAKEYLETLNAITRELFKERLVLGFGKESKRMVLVTPHVVAAFNPEAMSPEVIEEKRSVEGKEGAKVSSTRLLLKSHSGKDLVELYGKYDAKPELTNTVIVTTTKDTDVETLKSALSKLIALCGGKTSEQAAEPKDGEADKEELVAKAPKEQDAADKR